MPLNSRYPNHLLKVSSKPVCQWYPSGGLQRFAVHESSGLGGLMGCVAESRIASCRLESFRWFC